jgi:hypothetical protein
VTRRIAIAAAALAVQACFIHPRQPQPGPKGGEWAEAREEGTRAKQLYDGVVHIANAAATHLTPRVREARATRLADWLAWSPAELDRQLAQDRAEAAAGEEFVLAFYTADMYANDLDAPKSVWRVALVVDGVNVLPRKVEFLDADWTVKQLFPYVGPFDTVYRVRFPPAPEGSLKGHTYVLRLSSALGSVDLDWSRPPGEPEGFEIVPPAARQGR